MFDFLTFPFMQRALIAGIILAILLGWLGVYVISKNMSFVGDGVAHASLAAIAFAVLFGFAPLPVAIVFSIILAGIIHTMKKNTSIPLDAVIGIIFTTGMALGIILLQFKDGYMPDLVSFLFGNILTISRGDLQTMIFVGVILIFILGLWRRSFAFITVDPEGAELSGIKTSRMEFVLTVMVALSVVLSIKMIGIVLVSALLIIPSSSAKLLSKSFHSFLIISVLLAIVMVLAGIILSYYLDMPTGAVIVLTGTCLLGGSLGISKLVYAKK